ncbi:MAG: DUF4149 domain-containing protein [bacterium]
MKELILIISYWIHLVTTVIWIGGIAFILLIARPSVKQVLGKEAGKVMSEISRRFTPLANYSIVLLVITGILLTNLYRVENKWTTALIMKHFLVFAMIAIHFYRGLFLGPKIIKTVSDDEKAALQKLSINLVKVNFGLGIFVLLLSSISFFF